MPFKSQRQRKWMHANKPAMARRWERETQRSGRANTSSGGRRRAARGRKRR